jgi:putative two-component system response regulator
MEILRQGNCRVVITDWEMPGMSGLDLCQAIRRQNISGYVYIIMLTRHYSAAEAIKGLSAGADDFMSKPVGAAELAVRLRTAERILSLETRDVTLFAMAKLAESRDPETGTHLERVRNYCRCLADYMRQNPVEDHAVDGSFVNLIYLTSPLHDIGKIGIPDSILLKPGRLSDREFEIMKAHTTLGADTLDAALREYPDATFLQMARDIAAAHLERFDGAGYPLGLASGSIPLSARIMAVADVYDALTSKRVYKNAYSHEVANSIMLEESGTHFDPVVMDAFKACESQFVAIRERAAKAAA